MRYEIVLVILSQGQSYFIGNQLIFQNNEKTMKHLQEHPHANAIHSLW